MAWAIPGGRHSRGAAAASIDQVLSSASNLLFVLLIACVADVDTFASFSIAWTVVVLILALSPGGLSVHVSLSADESEEVLRQTRHGLGIVVVSAPLLAAIVALAPWISLRSVPVCAATGSLHPDRRALFADGLRLCCVLVGVGVTVGQAASAELSALLWGLGATLGLVLMMGTRRLPKFSGMRDWLKDGGRSRMALTSVGAAANASSAMLIGRTHGCPGGRGAEWLRAIDSPGPRARTDAVAPLPASSSDRAVTLDGTSALVNYRNNLWRVDLDRGRVVPDLAMPNNRFALLLTATDFQADYRNPAVYFG